MDLLLRPGRRRDRSIFHQIARTIAVLMAATGIARADFAGDLGSCATAPIDAAA